MRSFATQIVRIWTAASITEPDFTAAPNGGYRTSSILCAGN